MPINARCCGLCRAWTSLTFITLLGSIPPKGACLMETRVCDYCQHSYDPSGFSCGPKYCSPGCRQDARTLRQGRAGRPSLVPRSTDEMVETVKSDLISRGWLVCCGPADFPKARLMISKNGEAGFRVCVGGYQKDLQWAQVCAFTNPTNKVIYEPACRAGKRQLPDKKYLQRYACGRLTCRKCVVYKYYANIEGLPLREWREERAAVLPL